MAGTYVAALDRRAVIIIAGLVLIAAIVNVDRFVLGPSGPLRAHDLADNTITRLAGCGELWRSSLTSAWDGTRVRGWPIVSGDYAPQLLMCVAGGVVPAVLILPILHTVLLAVMVAGTFLFVQYFLERREDVAMAGAVLQAVLYFFFHEHPMVTSAILLPALVGYLSVPVRSWRSRALQAGGALLVMALSNPTSTLFAMPLGHLALIAVAPRGQRVRHLLRFGWFWLAYAVYYAPALLSQLREFANSSRSLYRPSPGVVSYSANLKAMLLNPAVISPAAVFLVLMNRRTWFRTLLFLLVIVVGVALAAANQLLVGSALARQFPIVLAVSTMYYRMYYFVPVALLIWATWLWHDDEDRSRPAVLIGRGLALAAFCVFIARPLAHTDWATVTVFGPYWRYSLVLGLSMAFGLRWWTRRLWTAAIVATAVLLFARYEHTRVWEVPFQGNLFLEQPNFGLPQSHARNVTVMSTCDGVDLFPAQARAAGMDTLDGISNLYDRSFTERWRYFVADNPALCTSRYAIWPSRAEVTVADLKYASDRILPWLWINNVEFVRATEPLDHPDLQLLDQRRFTYDKVQQVTRYLYRLRNPVGRVFTMPEAHASRIASGGLAAEESLLLDSARRGDLSTVDAEAVDGSHLRFRGTFDSGRILVASVNYHRGWRLRVDGRPSPVPLERGPFGMIAFRPTEGVHDYELQFRSPVTVLIPLCMVVAFAMVWVGSDRWMSKRLEPDTRRRAVVRALIAGLLVTALGGLAAAAVLRRRVADPRAAWFDDEWPHRVPLQTLGAGQTAALRSFPLRIECTSADTHFWTAVQPSGSDIRFADSSGRLLPFEIEEFDVARRRFVAWVKVPELATGPQTVAYLYYGNQRSAAAVNAEPVWDDQYEAVWHLNPRVVTRDGVIADSTGHDHTGRMPAAQTSAADGDRGISFGGGGAAIEIADWPGLHSAEGDWTVEFWIRPAPLNKRNFGLLQHGSAGTFHLYLHNGGFLVLERRNDGGTTETSLSREQIPPSEWTAVTLSRTRHHLRLALNGVAHSAYRVTPDFMDGAVTAPLRFGVGPQGPLDGRLAEVRITRGLARSADWVLASFRSQAESFTQRGAPEAR